MATTKPLNADSSLSDMQLTMSTLGATSHVIIQKIIKKEKREPVPGDAVRFQSEMIELLAAKYEVSATEEEVAYMTQVMMGVFQLADANRKG